MPYNKRINTPVRIINIEMRKLVKRLGFGVFVMALIPTAFLVQVILEPYGIESSTIVAVQLPFLAVQLFSGFMVIRYRREIF